MPVDDEYDIDPVESLDTGGYRAAVSEEAAAMGLEEAHMRWQDGTSDADLEEAYAAALGYANQLEYDVEAVHALCEEAGLAGRDGIYLSALADGLDAGTVRFPDLGGVDRVGYRNVTDIRIEGDVGDLCGADMRDGTIHVTGNAGTGTGKWLRGGEITVEGDVGEYCGKGMEAGTITVHGDATGPEDITGDEAPQLGEGMEGGTITVYGDGGGRVGQNMLDGTIHVHGDAGAHVGCAMEGGTIRIDGEAANNVGRAMYGGTLHVGRTEKRVGRLMHDGTIIVENPLNRRGVPPLERRTWPPLPTDASGGRILYGTGTAQEQVWPPTTVLGWARHAARIGGEIIDDVFREV